MNKCSLILIVFLCSCFVGEELPPDQEVWEYASPAEVGMNIPSLFDLNDSLMRNYFGLINGLILIKDDRLVFENYYNGYSRADIFNAGRLSFTTLVMAMDIFLENQLIESLDDPIYTYLPGYQNIFDADTVKKEITFRHILENKIGLSWDENGRVINDYAQMKSSNDWVNYILSKPRDTPNPGQRFSQNAAGGILLAKIMQNVLGDQDLKTYLMEHFFYEIGIRQVLWEESPDGTLNAANGLQMSTLDMTRLGYLMILEGRWTKKQRVISRDWVFDISSSQSIFDNQMNFGYGWKVLTDEFKSQIGLVGTSAYYMDGGLGQGLFIVPEYNFIASITAENFFANAESLSFALFFYTLRSIQLGAVN